MKSTTTPANCTMCGAATHGEFCTWCDGEQAGHHDGQRAAKLEQLDFAVTQLFEHQVPATAIREAVEIVLKGRAADTDAVSYGPTPLLRGIGELTGEKAA